MTRTATGTRSSPATRRRSTRRRCASSGSSSMSCPTTNRARTGPTTTVSIRTSRRPRPIPAWAPTSTCTTSGRWNRWARSRTAPRSISAPRDKAIMQYRRLLRQEIEKVAGGEKPMLFLDEAHARSIQGPATMDGIGPTHGLGDLLDGSRRQAPPRRAVGRAGAAARSPARSSISRRRSNVAPSLRSEAKQSSSFARDKEAGLLRRFAPRNDGPTLLFIRQGVIALSFVERHGLWSDEQKEAAGRLAASSRSKSSKSSASSFPDQHGILRGKTLIASEAIASLESGCSITTTCSPRTPRTARCFRCSPPAAASA